MTTSISTPEHTLPMVLTEIEVVAAHWLTPSFRRIEFTGDALADVGVDGPFYDQRIKLVFPTEAGALPSFAGADESWLSTWLDRPVAERGHMRTYTLRALTGAGSGRRLTVDFAVHTTGDIGPGTRWALEATPGDRVVLLAPRAGMPFGGIEFDPGAADRLLLVGDETAVPAIAAILAALPPTVQGAAFLEVPLPGDRLDLAGPPRLTVTWLVRDGRPHGDALVAAVQAHLGGEPAAVAEPDDVDPDLWETPHWSSSGESFEERATGSGLYAWIAGESRVVTRLRRHLVTDLGIARSQVAFMGYWRQGVSMRS